MSPSFSVGQIVHYYPASLDGDFVYPAAPMAAIVVYVHSATDVSLAVFGENGIPVGRRCVVVNPEGTTHRPCAWWTADDLRRTRDLNEVSGRLNVVIAQLEAREGK